MFYFMLNDEILCSISEIKSISITDITHTVSDIGMPELPFHLQLFNMADTMCLNRTFTQIRLHVNKYEDTT